MPISAGARRKGRHAAGRARGSRDGHGGREAEGTRVYQSDWILRQIEMMGLAFKRLLDALREHRPEEAVEVSREAAGELLDVDPAMLDQLTGAGLVVMLSAGGSLDVFRAHMLGELLAARAEAYAELGNDDGAAHERGRALALLRAALPESEGAEQVRILELIGWLEADAPRLQ